MMFLFITQATRSKREGFSVTFQEHVEQPAGLVKIIYSSIESFIRKTLVIAWLEARRLGHDPSELVTRAVQPALWLLVFGSVVGKTRAFTSGNLRYQDFMTPGILAQSVLFISIFYGISVLWERDLGITHKFLVSPTPRTALVLGKALSAGVRGLAQAIVIYLLALAIHVQMNWSPLALLGVIAAVILSASLFSTFSLVIACLVKTRERFMGIGQVMTMPLFFASNAIYPIDIMPTWLQNISKGNPLTYEVDALRTLMLAGGESKMGLGLDFAVLVAWTVLLVLLGGRLYANVVR
jgi:ABC-2 type transport system permease protein